MSMMSGIKMRVKSALHVSDPRRDFHSDRYLRHNLRRLEHLSTLNLPLSGRSVLELGAGIGDHTSFFLDRGCTVCATDPRPENLRLLASRYPSVEVAPLDLERPLMSPQIFDVVYAYGVLYHLRRPEEALEFMAGRCGDILLLETCVSFGIAEAINLTAEDAAQPSQAVSGTGCRPTRPWIWTQLRRHMPFVYMPKTQPWHEEFPLDWNKPTSRGLTRSIFIASRTELSNAMLVPSILMKQIRC